MTAVIHKIFVGAGEKHTLLPEETFNRSLSFGKYAHNRSRANMRSITAAKTIKNECHYVPRSRRAPPCIF